MTYVNELSQNQFVQATHQIMAILEQSKANVESLLDSLPNLIVVVDPSGMILKVNRKARELLGGGANEVLGKNLGSYFKPEAWARFQTEFHSVMAQTDTQVNFELSFEDSKADLIIAWNVKRFQMSRNKIGAGFAIFGMDVTLLRDYERQLSVLTSRLSAIEASEAETEVEGPKPQGGGESKDEDAVVQRFLELRRPDRLLVLRSLTELSLAFEQLNRSGVDRNSVFQAVRSIKAAARNADFNRITRLIQRLEDHVLFSLSSRDWREGAGGEALDQLIEEWRQLGMVARVLGFNDFETHTGSDPMKSVA